MAVYYDPFRDQNSSGTIAYSKFKKRNKENVSSKTTVTAIIMIMICCEVQETLGFLTNKS